MNNDLDAIWKLLVLVVSDRAKVILGNFLPQVGKCNDQSWHFFPHYCHYVSRCLHKESEIHRKALSESVSVVLDQAVLLDKPSCKLQHHLW